MQDFSFNIIHANRNYTRKKKAKYKNTDLGFMGTKAGVVACCGAPERAEKALALDAALGKYTHRGGSMMGEVNQPIASGLH